MGRLPFDPKRVQPLAETLSPARREARRYGDLSAAQHLTVTQLSDLIKGTLEDRLPSSLRVIGEVSNLSKRSHWYFSLKDEKSVMSCVAWASSARKFGFEPRDGEEVIASGKISHFGPQGRTQMYVESLTPVGAGALELRFRRMCEELRGLGYFEDGRKKRLPTFPQRIAVITSAKGAALQDVIATAKQRCCAVSLVIIDVRVQGEGAAQQIARAIQWVDQNRQRLGVEAMIVTRGGGSLEDLWAFNERCVADAAYGCALPLVAAVGHESDTTVIELVADLRAATPTQAAMRLIPASDELHKQIGYLSGRLTFIMRRCVDRARERMTLIRRHACFRDPRSQVRLARERLMSRHRELAQAMRHRFVRESRHLERLAARLGALRPQQVFADRRARLAVLSDRLQRAARRRIDLRPHILRQQRELDDAIKRRMMDAARTVASFERELRAIDPRLVLKRGYSYTTGADGSLIRSIRDIEVGMELHTNVADGEFTSTVSARRRRATNGKRAGRNAADVDQADGETPQMDLFRTRE